MPIETIITAAIMTVGYMYNYGAQKNKTHWLAKIFMPWKVGHEYHEPKKVPLMIYVNKDYKIEPQVQNKKPDLKLIEK